jgi:DNA-binding MarR family transcriptional regulator
MKVVSVEKIQGRERSRRSSRVDAVQVRLVERCSRVIANITVQALDSVQATTSPTQVRALLVLDACGGCSNAQLAAMLEIFPSSASRLTDRLTAAGMVTRQESTGDRREVRLVLTPMGHRGVERFVESRVAIIARTMASMKPADRAALLRGLKAFSAAAEARQPRVMV